MKKNTRRRTTTTTSTTTTTWRRTIIRTRRRTSTTRRRRRRKQEQQQQQGWGQRYANEKTQIILKQQICLIVQSVARLSEVTSWHIHTFSSSRWARRLQLVTSRLHKQVSAPHPPRLYQRVSLWRRFWKVSRRRRVPTASLAEELQKHHLFIIIISLSDSWRLIAQMHTHTHAGLWILNTPFQTHDSLFFIRCFTRVVFLLFVSPGIPSSGPVTRTSSSTSKSRPGRWWRCVRWTERRSAGTTSPSSPWRWVRHAPSHLINTFLSLNQSEELYFYLF